jgi:hypothetical protein
VNGITGFGLEPAYPTLRALGKLCAIRMRGIDVISVSSEIE